MSARTRTVEVDFEIATLASPDEWRAALDELESRVPEQHRGTLCVWLRGESSYDVPYVDIRAYYEVEETEEDVAAREAQERAETLRRYREQVCSYEQWLADARSRIAALEKEGGAE